ncbi:hypothetical protein NC651_005531 [Populus alba x Populus x berolinensis]|nr:hypothetical protein NC651_005531 [Populus alba x Populus x berolinensis]
MDTGLNLVENTGMPIARCSYFSLAHSAVFSYNLLHVYWYWSVANSYFMKLKHRPPPVAAVISKQFLNPYLCSMQGNDKLGVRKRSLINAAASLAIHGWLINSRSSP